MTRALAALHDGTYGGVYYSANIDFTNSGFNPTWTKYATTGLANTLIKVMRNDRFDPYNHIYLQLDNNDIYHWNGASWTKIMDAATASALTGGSDAYGYVYADTLTPGTIYFPCQKAVTWLKLLKSVDYGANWTVITVVSTTITGNPYVTAHGQNVIATTADPFARAYFSTNGGTLWSGGAAGRTSVPHRQDPHNPGNYYDPVSNVNKNLSIYSVSGSSVLQNGSSLATAYDVSNSSVHIFDYNVPGYQRLLLPAAGTLKLYITTDYWANATTPATWNDYGGYLVNMKTMAAAIENSDFLLIGGGSNGSAGVCRVYAKNGNDATVPWVVSGANYAAAPYTDSIPTPVDSYIAYNGLWVGEAPASVGAYVYADEFGDITDIPTYTGLGRPMFGDRSAWRDRPVDGYDIYHAEDVEREEPQIHAPWDDTDPPPAGYGIVSDGTHWIVSSDEMALITDFDSVLLEEIDALAVPDAYGTGIKLGNLNAADGNELAAGSGTFGAPNVGTLTLFDAAGNTLWTYNSPNNDYALGLDVGDIDLDGANEIAVGFHDQEHSGFLISAAGAFEWAYDLGVGEYCRAARIGKVRADYTGNQVVFGGSGGVLGLCDKVGNTIWELKGVTALCAPSCGVGSYRTVQSIDIGDTDNDGQAEIIIAYGKYIKKITHLGVTTWTTTVGEGAGDDSLAWGVSVGHVRGTANLEIAAAIGNIGTGTINAVKLLDKDGTVIWTWDCDYPCWSVKIADVNNDGNNEIIVGYGTNLTGPGGVSVLSWSGIELGSVSLGTSIKFVDFGDANDCGLSEIVASGDAGEIYIISVTPQAITGKVRVSSNDKTYGYLNGKLVAGTYTTLTENDNGEDETLTIDVDTGALPTPAHALDDHTDVDTTGVGTGDILYKSAGDWIDYPLGIGSNITNDGSSINIGDIAGGNYLSVDLTTGEIGLNGDATVFEDIRVEPVVRQAAGAGVPAFEKYFDDAPGTSKGVYLLSFTDEAVAGNEKEVFFNMQMPHSWKIGSDIHVHVHFVPAATVNSSDIIWGLEYCWKSIGEVFGDTVIIQSSTTLLPDDANITASKHYLAEFADISPGPTASSLSSILIGRLFRNSSVAGDTYTNKVGLLYIDAHYEVDSLGSTEEYQKSILLADSDGETLLDSDGVELTE